jgi:predicted Zn-dependent protease
VNDLAYALAKTGGDLDEALKLAETALRHYPGNLAFNDTLGSVNLKKKQFSSAVHIFESARDKSPKEVNFRIHLGQALLAGGNSSQSREELHAAMKLPYTPEERETIERLLGNYSINSICRRDRSDSGTGQL